MTKQLRLAVGELTDVGRRRERNQDNVIHFVPTDADLLARRGALFVVCDGMGGHAAGEIASEIGVRTIREVYFQETDEDVVTALARAIRSANNAIFEHAREHQTHSGMGTTCVVLALVGGRGFFANIGDSRGYILRDGSLRQVTQDHSWVAEQVRAGILTEEQARVHAHRNVITRSLGTQPDVTADLFIEEMREGDRVLLCSDGLHGYVAEEDILQTMQVSAPEPVVRQLIDIANSHGGPDNITAVVVHLLEVPEVTQELNLPETIKLPRDVRDRIDETTRPLVPELAHAARATSTDVLPRTRPAVAAAANVSDAAATTSATSAGPSRRRRSVLPVVALRLLAVAALLFLSFGLWDVVAGPYSVDRAANQQALRDVASAQSAARAAPDLAPSHALATLASAQQQLRQDLANLPLDDQGRVLVQHALDTVVAPAVRSALQTYNDLNQITTLPASAVTTYAVSCCSGTPANGPQALAFAGALPLAAGQSAPVEVLYELTGDGALYKVTISPSAATATCGTAPVVPQGVKAVANDQPQVYALAQQGTGWTVLQVGADGKTTAKITLPTNAPSGATPVALAAHGGDYYIAFNGPQAGQGGIWHFAGSDLKKPAQTITTPESVTALGAAASGATFAMLADGNVVGWDPQGHVAPVSIALAPLVVTADPNAYVAATPVPTLPATPSPVPTADATATPQTATGSLAPQATSSATSAPTTATTPTTPTATAAPTPTATAVGSQLSSATNAPFGATSSLTADRTSTSGDIFVGDGGTPRVVRFAVNGSDLQLVHQYVYGAPLATLQSVTTSADGSRLYAWSGTQLVEVTLPA